MAKILVVDDEEGVREFLAEALRADGHAVTALDNGQAALRELSRSAFDVMLTDLKMPGLSGIELLRRSRALDPDLEVLILTAYGAVHVAVEAMKLGAFDFLLKPVSSPIELRLHVSRALEHRSLIELREKALRSEQEEPTLVHASPAMQQVVRSLEKVARTDATVLLTGESGTGKEVAARTLHRKSSRAGRPFVAVSCAALSEHLLESELFGHERGAFTGAHTTRKGRIELARGGTFFLDEVGELKPTLQGKLLRVLQERSFERVGGSKTIDADVRWVAATNRDLNTMVEQGEFREDLYHRLAVFPVRLPALRERPEDIVPLTEDLLARISKDLGRKGVRLDDSAILRIQQARWLGNVRELNNALERALILAEGSTISASHIELTPLRSSAPPRDMEWSGTLEDIERRAIEAALREVNGNRKRAAEKLGIGLRTLYDKLQKFRLG